MGKHSPQALAPRYMSSFHCVGAACPDNCCTGWAVSIDKPSYQRYRDLREEPLASLLGTGMKKVASPTSNRYAVIALKPEQPCPLLDESHLCRIQAALGEGGLSDVCASFPRIFSREDGVLHMHATLSCPEAARLALQSAQAMEPVMQTVPYANPGLVPTHQRRNSPPADSADAIDLYAPAVRAAVTLILKDPGLSVAEGLVYAGMMLRRLAQDAHAEAPQLALARSLDFFLSSGNLLQARSLVADLQVPTLKRRLLLLEALQACKQRLAPQLKFQALVADFERGLALDGLDEHAQQQRFDVLEARVSARLAAEPHLLKNYLLNDLGKGLFPAQGLATMEADFMSLAVRYALIRSLLTGLAGLSDEGLSSEQVCRAVYLVVRHIEHSPQFMPGVLARLDEAGLMGLDALATLVK